jgi:hypothetical protein
MSNVSTARATVVSRAQEARVVPVVHLRYQGHLLGLYGVRAIEPDRLTVGRGAVSLPVGTHVLVDDVLGLLPHTGVRMVPAKVTANGSWGMRLKL